MRLLALVVAITLAGITFAARAGDADPLKVGVIMPLTGPYGPLGTESLTGVQAAADVVNKAGGVNGRRIELIVLDDKTAPDQSIIAFKNLVGQGVVGVIGSLFSNSAVATAPLAEAAHIPYIGTATADEQIDPVKDYVFIASVPMEPVAEAILKYVKSLSLSKIAVVYDSKNAFSVSGSKHFQELGPKYGIENVVVEPIASNATDFSSVFVRMQGAKADAVVFWGIGSAAIAFTKQYRSSGIELPLIMSTAQASINRFVSPAGPAAEGVTVATLLPDIGSKLPASTVKDAYERIAVPYKAKNGTDLSGFSAGGASALILMAEGIRLGGTDPAKLQSVLSTLKTSSPYGNYQFSPTRHFGLGSDYVAITKVIDGSFVPTDWTIANLKRAAAAN